LDKDAAQKETTKPLKLGRRPGDAIAGDVHLQIYALLLPLSTALKTLKIL
jgi:hypothetical protein